MYNVIRTTSFDKPSPTRNLCDVIVKFSKPDEKKDKKINLNLRQINLMNVEYLRALNL